MADKILNTGLDALLGDVAAPNKQSIKEIDLAQIKPNRFQPRQSFNEQKITELSQSIAKHGILSPILVRETGAGGFELIAGERRLRAAKQAGLQTAPCMVDSAEDQLSLELALIENLQREDLTPIEEAEGYKRLMDQFARTQGDLAREIGKSRSHVANTIRLLSLPDSVRESVQDGRLSAGHARALLGADDPAAAAIAVIKKALNVRQTETMIRRERDPSGAVEGRGRPPAPEKDPNTAALERDLGNLLGLKVEIEDRGEVGTLKFHYASLDQLDDILQRITGGEHR